MTALALARALVAVKDAHGRPTGATYGPGTLSVRGGQATITVHGRVLAQLDAAMVERHGATHYTVHGPDGAGSWDVRRKGG